MIEQPGPLDVLVVGWFPALDDAGSGRFIADQVAALAATGRVRPAVASFDAVPLFGDPAASEAEAAAARTALGSAIRTRPDVWTARGAHGPEGIPVARLGIVAGETPTTGLTHQADHRTDALLDLVANPGTPRIDLVHGHVGYPEGLSAARSARRLGVPFVLTEHATYLDRLLAEPGSRAGYAEAIDAASRIVAVSRMLGQQLVTALPEIEPKLRVIPNAIAVDDFRLVGPGERDPDELLWVGYRKAVKGMDTLLRAFALTRAHRPTLRLRLVGRSVSVEDERTWERLADELGVREAVRFDPPIDRAGVADAMARAALFVHPSTRETFGVVAVEALASGLPVVACDSGGVTEVLGDEPEALGALVPAGDPQALAVAIEATLERRSTLDPAALRAFVAERYRAAAVASRLADLYEEVRAEARALAPAAERARPAGAPPTDPRPVTGPGRSRTSPTLVVGALRGQLDRALAAAPTAFSDTLTVVATGTDATPAGRTILAEAETDRLAVRWIHHGRGPVRRRGPLGLIRAALTRAMRRPRGRKGSERERERLEAEVLGRLQRAIEMALDGWSSDPPTAVGLSGVDHLALAKFVEGGRVRPAPGGLRWLGDRWWSDGGPSGSDASEAAQLAQDNSGASSA